MKLTTQSLGAPTDIGSVRIGAGHFYRGKWPFYREKLCLECVWLDFPVEDFPC